jgi:hypothetical protein
VVKAGGLAACCRAGLMACPLIDLPAAVEAAGSRAAAGRRGAIAVATLESGETAAQAVRPADQPRTAAADGWARALRAG